MTPKGESWTMIESSPPWRNWSKKRRTSLARWKKLMQWWPRWRQYRTNTGLCHTTVAVSTLQWKDSTWWVVEHKAWPRTPRGGIVTQCSRVTFRGTNCCFLCEKYSSSYLTCRTIIFPLWTNQILCLWRCCVHRSVEMHGIRGMPALVSFRKCPHLQQNWWREIKTIKAVESLS